MARGKDEDERVIPWPRRMTATTGGGPRDPGMEARVAKLESAVEHLQADMTEVRASLSRVEPRIAEMAGAFPHLATKAELEKRPTIAGIIAIVALIAAVASIPIRPEWVAALKAIAVAGH
jgi:hypothetical protein